MEKKLDKTPVFLINLMCSGAAAFVMCSAMRFVKKLCLAFLTKKGKRNTTGCDGRKIVTLTAHRSRLS